VFQQLLSLFVAQKETGLSLYAQKYFTKESFPDSAGTMLTLAEFSKITTGEQLTLLLLVSYVAR